MDDFVSKPFEAAALIGCLSRQIFADGLLVAGPSESLLPAPRVLASLDVSLAPRAAIGTWPEIEGIDGEDARDRFADNATLFRSLMRIFLRDYACLAAPAEPLDGGALATQAALMHKLRGSAGQMGAVAVDRLASECEEACRAGDASRASLRAAELSAQWRLLAAAAERSLS